MAAPESNNDLTFRCITQLEEWDSIKRDWDKLYSLVENAAAPLRFQWMRKWWEIYGPVYGADGLRILTVWRKDKLVSVLPLYINKGFNNSNYSASLMFISTGEREDEEVCPDYLDMLCHPKYVESCAGMVWDEIKKLKWDSLEFINLPLSAKLLNIDPRYYPIEISSGGSCLRADLSEGFEDYVQSLTSSNRQNVRRLLRLAENTSAQLTIVTPEGIEPAWEELKTLHQERWNAVGEPGVFSAKRFHEFHADLHTEWTRDGKAILARLVVNGETAAVIYGFVAGDVFEFYQSGVGQQTELKSPGIVAHLLLMRELSQRGIQAYDFLKGNSEYKKRLGNRENPLVKVTAVHRHYLSWFRLGLDFFRNRYAAVDQDS